MDVNHDAEKDLVNFCSGGNTLSIFLQEDNYTFDANYLLAISTSNQLTDRFIENALLTDIDDDGSLEILTVNGINKFSYINFK